MYWVALGKQLLLNWVESKECKLDCLRKGFQISSVQQRPQEGDWCSDEYIQTEDQNQ